MLLLLLLFLLLLLLLDHTGCPFPTPFCPMAATAPAAEWGEQPQKPPQGRLGIPPVRIHPFPQPWGIAPGIEWWGHKGTTMRTSFLLSLLPLSISPIPFPSFPLNPSSPPAQFGGDPAPSLSPSRCPKCLFMASPPLSCHLERSKMEVPVQTGGVNILRDRARSL